MRTDYLLALAAMALSPVLGHDFFSNATMTEKLREITEDWEGIGHEYSEARRSHRIDTAKAYAEYKRIYNTHYPKPPPELCSPWWDKSKLHVSLVHATGEKRQVPSIGNFYSKSNKQELATDTGELNHVAFVYTVRTKQGEHFCGIVTAETVQSKDSPTGYEWGKTRYDLGLMVVSKDDSTRPDKWDVPITRYYQGPSIELGEIRYDAEGALIQAKHQERDAWGPNGWKKGFNGAQLEFLNDETGEHGGPVWHFTKSDATGKDHDRLTRVLVNGTSGLASTRKFEAEKGGNKHYRVSEFTEDK